MAGTSIYAIVDDDNRSDAWEDTNSNKYPPSLIRLLGLLFNLFLAIGCIYKTVDLSTKYFMKFKYTVNFTTSSGLRNRGSLPTWKPL